MTPEEQKALVLAQLAKRERIATDTRAHLDELDELDGGDRLDPLLRVDPAIRRAAEDEHYAAQGRRRYETSDGRTIYLTPEEIAVRRRTRSGRAEAEGAGKSRYYGPTGDRDRRWLTWGFNSLAVLLAFAVVYLILH